MSFRSVWRKFVNVVMLGLTGLCALAAVSVLLFILGYLVWEGGRALNWAFLTELPKPVGETGGGMANAIMGTLTLIGLASCVGVPVGILGGIYLAEMGDGRLGGWVRFTADVLNGLPSIVIGVFVYALVVVPMRRFSAIAGGVALGVMMVPLVVRTTEEIVRLVPHSLREASLALGIRWWKTSLQIVLRTATAGVITGIMLAISRIGGETAPLLFTAFNNQYWQTRLDQPISSLTVQLFTYSIAPYDDWHRQAWAAALVLMTITLLLNVAARFAGRQRFASRRR
jgi:phosphate transport system permease protein